MALAVAGTVFAALVVASSSSAGPRGWGVHAAGFLPLPLRLTIFALLLASVAALWLSALEKEPRPRGARRRAGLPMWLPALLLPYAAVLWALRARTQLLGDGAVWLATVSSGEHRPYSEPLFAALWHGFAALVRRTGRAPDATSMSLFPVLCGVLAALLIAGIAKETDPERRFRIIPMSLLMTLGVSQLYFGYIESYAMAAVFILLYLWLALRRTHGMDPPFFAAAALALAMSAHLSALYLLPSYLLLVSLEKRPLAAKLLWLALPVASLAALLVALGYRPSHWAVPIHAATSGIREGFERATLHRPYTFFSYGHLSDVLNAVLLAMPGPAILLIGWAAATRARFRPFPRHLAILAAAAIPGALLGAWLMTPVAPAQDWDLMSIFLLPAAVFGVAAGTFLWSGRAGAKAAAALAVVSAASLLAFVLVNASERTAVARFAAVVNDPVRVSRYGRAYGNSLLELHFRSRGLSATALPYARAAVAAEPTNPRNWTNVGFELMQLGRQEEAIPVLQEAVRRGPGRWEGAYNLGLCYMKLGRYAEAVPPLRDAVRLEGNLPFVRHNLGLSLYRSGRADSALVVWREVLLRWPGYAASLRLPEQ
jgi:tetratricopeptide (TPR) repeat protein